MASNPQSQLSNHCSISDVEGETCGVRKRVARMVFVAVAKECDT